VGQFDCGGPKRAIVPRIRLRLRIRINIEPMARIFRLESGMSLWQAVVDYIASKWLEVIIVFIGGGGMAYLAAITAWLQPWGPVAWGAIAIISAIIIWITFFVVAFIASKKSESQARANLEETLSKNRDRINRLDRHFSRVVIAPSDLFMPYDPVLEAKQFTECDFIGPGVILFIDRCEVLAANFLACNFVVFDDKRPANIQGTLGFRSSRFEKCRFVNMTFLIPASIAESWLIPTAFHSQQPTFIGFDFTKK
jgi:hypothetical protein